MVAPLGYAKVIRYGDIKKNLPGNLKISPVAIILQKSQFYHKMLDLYFYLQHLGGLIQSVNSAIEKYSPEEAIIHLVHCEKQLIATLAENY